MPDITERTARGLHDLVLDGALTREWRSGAFLGDGLTGAMVYRDDAEGRRLRWELGRTDVVAHHRIPGVDWCPARLPVGDLLLCAAGRPRRHAVRLDLWNAEARGRIETDRGALAWRSLVLRDTHAVVVEGVEEGEERAELEFREAWGISPRARETGKPLEEVVPPEHQPPRPRREADGDVRIVVQPLTRTGAHASAWCVCEAGARLRRLIFAVEPCFRAEQPRTEDEREAVRRAVAAVRAVREADFNALVAAHRAWWHGYYRLGGIELPGEPEWERFYWIQLYKFACAARGDVPVAIDTLGPWMTQVAWPGTWWNLNVQLSYMPAYSANRLEQGLSLLGAIENAYRSGHLARNLPAAHRGARGITVGRATSVDMAGSSDNEGANLTWALHNLWRQWKYSMDDGVAERLFPLLKDNVRYLLDIAAPGADGRLHLPPMVSPEYPGEHADTAYALAALRWALETLLALDARLDRRDASRSEWADALDRLAPLPAGEHGLMVGRDAPFDISHRHFSHLLALYPLHLVTPDQGPEAEALFRRSLERWLSLKGGWAGYTCTGSAAMYAVLGEAGRAREQLDCLRRFVEPNTMYLEGPNPVIETPLSAVESINYMLLQSWGGIIRVFPALPTEWGDVRFENLRAEGAFLVSAAREEGRTAWIRISSLAGEPLRVRPGFAPGVAVRVERDGRPVAMPPAPGGVIELDLPRGATVELRSAGS